MDDPFGPSKGSRIMGIVLTVVAASVFYVVSTPARKERWQVPFVAVFGLVPLAVAVAFGELWLVAYVPFAALGGSAMVWAVRFCGQCGRTALVNERFCRSCGTALNDR